MNARSILRAALLPFQLIAGLGGLVLLGIVAAGMAGDAWLEGRR